jgi:hypothetical protein
MNGKKVKPGASVAGPGSLAPSEDAPRRRTLVVKESYRTWTLAEWRTEATRLFGQLPLQWKFQCPICGNVQTGAEFKARGAEPERAYRECIGRLSRNPARQFAAEVFLPYIQTGSGQSLFEAFKGSEFKALPAGRPE